jgi:hypothetical protein
MGFGAALGAKAATLSFDAAADDAYALGFNATPDLPMTTVHIGGLSINLHAPGSDPLFSDAKAAAAVGESQPSGADESSRQFLEGLIQRGEVDFSAAAATSAAASALVNRSVVRPTKLTHAISEDGGLVLKRVHFNCGCIAPGLECALA